MELGDPPSAPPNTERKRHSGNIEEEEDDDNDHAEYLVAGPERMRRLKPNNLV